MLLCNIKKLEKKIDKNLAMKSLNFFEFNDYLDIFCKNNFLKYKNLNCVLLKDIRFLKLDYFFFNYMMKYLNSRNIYVMGKKKEYVNVFPNYILILNKGDKKQENLKISINKLLFAFKSNPKVDIRNLIIESSFPIIKSGLKEQIHEDYLESGQFLSDYYFIMLECLYNYNYLDDFFSYSIKFFIKYYKYRTLNSDKDYFICEYEKFQSNDYIEGDDVDPVDYENLIIRNILHKALDIDKILSCLNEKDKLIIKLKFGLIDGLCHSYAYIGEKIGISRQRVYERYTKALAILKKSNPIDRSEVFYDIETRSYKR